MNTILASGLTDIGKYRQKNEDSIYLDTRAGLYIVSDGIGGMENGNEASRMVVERLPMEIHHHVIPRYPIATPETLDTPDIRASVARAFSAMNTTFRNRFLDRFNQVRAGATVVLCLVQKRTAMIAHLGDSRAYLVRNNELRQMTCDHTVYELLMKNREINNGTRPDNYGKNQLTLYAGMDQTPDPDIEFLAMEQDDLILLCSDGLTHEVSDSGILDIITRYSTDVNAACRALVDAANAAGGKDNISVILIRSRA